MLRAKRSARRRKLRLRSFFRSHKRISRPPRPASVPINLTPPGALATPHPVLPATQSRPAETSGLYDGIKLPRGRPSRANRALARRKKQLEAKITELFDHRYLFVQHDLTPAEKKKVIRISRGLPHLRTLRDIMDEVYRLFDRRCRTATALKKLAKLRARVRRFK